MTNLTILIGYDGKWVNSVYKCGKTKALVVSDKVTYEELRDRLYGVIKVDPNEYGIIIKAVYSGKSLNFPVEVVDDNDVTAFICESLARDWKIPLCITLERRVLASGSGSNQHALISLATQTTKSHCLDPNAELVEQNYIAFNSDPVPMDFSSGTQANSDCGTGLTLDNFENNKQHDNIELHVEHNNPEMVSAVVNRILRDDVPRDNLHVDELLCANLQFDKVPHDSLEVDNEPHDNMHCGDVPLNPPNSLPCTRHGRKLSGKMANTMLNVEGDIGQGSFHKSKKDLQKKLGLVAMKNKFEFRVTRSTNKRFEVECVNDSCTWRLRATKSPDFEHFMVRRYDGRHSCSLDAVDHSHRQASSSLIGEYVKSKYKGVSRQYKPKDIIEDMQKDLGVNISYGTAWRACQRALKDIRGSPEEFSLMPQSCERHEEERIQSHGEEQSTRKCGKCGSTGHNRKTCKNPTTLLLNSKLEMSSSDAPEARM